MIPERTLSTVPVWKAPCAAGALRVLAGPSGCESGVEPPHSKALRARLSSSLNQLGATTEHSAPLPQRRVVNRRQSALAFTELGNALDERPGVRVLGLAKNPVRRSLFDNLAPEHHGDTIGDAGDDAEIVGNQDHAHLQLLFEIPQADP